MTLLLMVMMAVGMVSCNKDSDKQEEEVPDYSISGTWVSDDSRCDLFFSYGLLETQIGSSYFGITDEEAKVKSWEYGKTSPTEGIFLFYTPHLIIKMSYIFIREDLIRCDIEVNNGKKVDYVKMVRLK